MAQSDFDTDILISGGGPAGLSAAAILGTLGQRVVLVDPAPPITTPDEPGSDLRTTAIMQPGQALLEEAGVWPLLAPHTMPLDRMRIVNAAGRAVSRDFVSRDISDQPFGWNLPNWRLRQGLMDRLTQLSTVTVLTGTGFEAMTARAAHALVRLSDGRKVTAKLVLACDGRNSAVRQANGISVRKLRYGQVAVTFAATHPTPHENVSIEVHRSGGPFTLVPLPDLDGAPCSAVVWMTSGPDARELTNLPDADFERAATDRSAGVLGPLRLASRRQSWPIIAQVAARFHAPRVALAAEAAHVVPPIGAQGLNMSLADLAELRRLIEANPNDPGASDLLRSYHRRRWPEANARVLGVDLLNRASQSGLSPLQTARGIGLGALHDIAPVRHTLMRMGLGTGR